ncbi:xanthine dehydrogenase family protein molybdopterin-binding subunit [Alsobacter sp. KACC 23698]|uniref:Xanthine dehydrogenase family protein molybdopterin-binding subunit n=1 Tax=Alsobacter sp. KACC 23698 TaxID=3149229 RepID=A0AAU7JGR0_9HYPH
MVDAAPEPKVNMGQPAPRIDGRLKVTGAARYASDMPVANPAFAVLVTSPIAKGKVLSIDPASVLDMPGVLDVLTHQNASGEVKAATMISQGGTASTSIRPLETDQIFHDGQIVAMVVADTFEAARDAAYRLKARYFAERPSAGFDAPGAQERSAKDASEKHEDPQVGDAEQALATADVVVEGWYETPTQHHNPIELFTTTCLWSGAELTVHEPSQTVYGLRAGLAEQLGMDQQDIRIVSRFIGGAFGSKGAITPRTALVAIAARRLGRPVKLVTTRDQGYTVATYRAETRHHVRLGASRDGRLTALSHEGWEVTSRPDAYMVAGTDTTARMYKVPNVFTKVNIVHADRNTPGFMRSPPEVPYMFALESAMDELAFKLDMDPVELRRVNDTMNEPIKGLPYTSRSLMQCYDAAAEAFGWSGRDRRPGSMRDGDWLIGWGCATACYPTQLAPAAARVRYRPQGGVRVETAGHEIGTGAYTVVAQMASEKLGVPLEDVDVVMGDTQLPPAPVAGGSISTASVCSAVALACERIIGRLVARAEPQTTASVGGPGAGLSGWTIAQGKLIGPGGEFHDVGELFKALGAGAIEEYGEFVPHGSSPDALAGLYAGKSGITGGSRLKDRIQYAFGAEFVEVRVHARTREIRAPRLVGAFAAGHIMNPRTARSQLMGGLIWGLGSALHERTEIDVRAARYVNDNLAEYLIPVNADVAEVKVILLSEEDQLVNPSGIKGLGELGNVGTNAAVANAVHHATGKRIRSLPIRIEHLLDA